MGAAMPFPLVVPREHDESDAAPPVGKLPFLPACPDAEAQYRQRVLRQQQPFPAALDVSLARVVPEAEHLRLLADVIHDGGTEVVQPEQVNVEAQASVEQRFRRIEMCADNARI